MDSIRNFIGTSLKLAIGFQPVGGTMRCIYVRIPVWALRICAQLFQFSANLLQAPFPSIAIKTKLKNKRKTMRLLDTFPTDTIIYDMPLPCENYQVTSRLE